MKILREIPEHLFWLGAACVLAYAYLGYSDYEEAVKAHEVYCENVASGAWPNYDEADCDGL